MPVGYSKVLYIAEMAIFNTFILLLRFFVTRGFETQIHALQKTKDLLEKSQKADLNRKLP